MIGVQTSGGTPVASNVSPVGLSDPTGNAERVARLYQAELGRPADLGGLHAYASAVDQGTVSLAQVADALVTSPEFMRGQGYDDAAFVDRLYRNLFGRPADPGTGYVAALQAGASKGEVANDIAQSLEAKLDYLPYKGDRSLGILYRLYEAAFGRAPDPSGTAAFVPLLDAGLSPQVFAASLINSPEFAATPGGTNGVPYFVAQAYQGALGRGPKPEGLALYAGAIAGGEASRAQVLADIANSSEARAHTALATHDGRLYLPNAT